MSSISTPARIVATAKQKAVKLTPDVIRAVENARQTLPGRMNFSDVLRQAVDLWLGNAPQVLDPQEFWALKTLRAAARASERERTRILLYLAEQAAELDAEWPSDLVATLRTNVQNDGYTRRRSGPVSLE